MYYRDHHPPHFHAIYREYEAQIVIETLEPLVGELPARALRLVLRLGFDDGTTRDVDLEDELWGPVFEPLRQDPELFRQVRVDQELGTVVVWPNGADLDPDVLHGDLPSAASATAE